MKRIIFLPFILLLLFAAAVFYYFRVPLEITFLTGRGVLPAITPPPKNIAEILNAQNQTGQNTTDIPLKLPPGFSISIFAKDLPGARVMKFDQFGNMWVSQTSQGQITLLTIENGQVIEQAAVLRDLNKPHGLAFDPENKIILYYAEEDKISRLLTYTDASPVKIADLPSGGGHFTRTLGIGPDNRLYVSVGSSCNVCNEADSRRAKIFSLEKDGSDFKEFARGLRNAVFFAWHPKTLKIWTTEMGRDLLGDDIPPDEINIVEQNKNYGWPICYGKNIPDRNFNGAANDTNCAANEPSYIDIPAHSAPLGLAFFPRQGWPQEFWDDLLVAYHGSWNRSEPTGYKIIRYKLDEDGNLLGAEDFISGWLTPDGALGRPVDILISPDGILYISDDHAGVIYKVTYNL